MRRTRLIAILVALAAIATVTADAAAYYNPRLGRFISRDPGPGPALPMRVGAAGPAVAGSFAQRDPTGTNQYADGMNLYLYARSNPTRLVDPYGDAAQSPMEPVEGDWSPVTIDPEQDIIVWVPPLRTGHAAPTGSASRKTRFWHFRGYGKPKIYSIAGEEQHSVISIDRSETAGVDYGPREKKGGKKGKKIDGLAWLFWGAPGYTKVEPEWEIQFKLDYSRTTEAWKLCIKDTGTMKVNDKDVECKCATEDQVKSCITRVAKAWNGTTWKRGHDCRHFVQAAETECCLEKCSP